MQLSFTFVFGTFFGLRHPGRDILRCLRLFRSRAISYPCSLHTAHINCLALFSKSFVPRALPIVSGGTHMFSKILHFQEITYQRHALPTMVSCQLLCFHCAFSWYDLLPVIPRRPWGTLAPEALFGSYQALA